MKKRIVLMCVLAMCIANMSGFEVYAEDTSFSITAKSSYGETSTQNTKMDDELYAAVNWQGSSESSHKEWFQVVNSGLAIRSESKLFPYLHNGTLTENSQCTYGYYYYLRARREHITNPSTTVSGIWAS